jgi:MFS transporter, AAHS family, benzoate transport protein
MNTIESAHTDAPISLHQGQPADTRSAMQIVAICGLIMLFDGYDLYSFATIVPSLLSESSWGLTPVQVGMIGSLATLGMLLGALAAGMLADLIGRRNVVIGCTAWFSFMMIFCATASSPEALALFRFSAGVGLGGVIPVATALTIESVPAERRTFYYAWVMGGHPLGGMVAAILAIVLIPEFGWRSMLWVGALPLVVIVPFAMKFLAESSEYAAGVAAKGARGYSQVKLVFSREYVRNTILFCIAAFAGLLLIYGLNTWIPQIMRAFGRSVNSALGFMIALNLGAVLGMVFCGEIADRYRANRATCIGAFAAGAAALLVLALAELPSLLGYLVAFVAGLGVIGSQGLLNALISSHYPSWSRATALGVTLGVGRLGAVVGPFAGGVLLTAQNGAFWSLVALAGCACLACAVLALVSPLCVVATEST